MKKLILFSAIVLLSIQTIVEAQPNVSQCIGRKVNVYTKVDVPSIYKERSLLQKTASIYFQVIESTENPLPPAARQALDKAVDIWSYLIDSGQDITIYAEWIDMGWDEDNDQGTLASCGPNSFAKNFTGVPVQNTQYPIALAEAISNSNLNGSNHEIVLSINSNSNIDWYTGTDAVTQENKFDLVTVLLHEIAHGLGYSDSFDNRNGLGSYGEPSAIFEGYPTIYDQYCVVGSAHPSNDKLINYNQGSSTLADKLTSENIYYDGHISYLVNNNSSAKLYAPPVWAPGSSIAHLDGDVYTANNRNSLMTHERDMAEVVHSPGELGLSILADIGWSVNRLMIINFPTVETTLTKGSTINIKWAENQGGYVDLVLYRIVSGDPQFERVIDTSSLYSNKGENNYAWTIPSSPTEVPVGEYRIELEYN
ncbi:MAG: GPI anchored serine-threonine rich family protein, partial [Bacteroidetes bacterium]|nr:GPI anchored serine-threonine rich family protein [Bacteroidota bacterium]